MRSIDKSTKLYRESLEYHPGGVLGIRRPYNFVENEYPIFIDSGKGGKIVDVDGNEYIDMLCSYGPIVLGHREKYVDDNVIDQITEKGFNFSLTQPIHNTLGKLLTELIPCADQCILLKTGSDVTTASVRAARAFTGRNKIMRCGYHGWQDWCVEVKGGVPKSVSNDTIPFEFNDFDRFEEIFNENKEELAAVIMWPVHTPLGSRVEYSQNSFLEKVREITKNHNVILIFDEIRTGFRFNLGGYQSEVKVIPDLATFGKAMANGYSIAALVGRRDIMEMYSSKSFVSGTYFENSLSMRASLATIEFMKENNVLAELKEKGIYFTQRAKNLISKYENMCEISGEYALPYVTFLKDSKGLYKKRRTQFFTDMIRQGVLWAPYHHSYFCYRHSYLEIDQVLNSLEYSLKSAAKVC